MIFPSGTPCGTFWIAAGNTGLSAVLAGGDVSAGQAGRHGARPGKLRVAAPGTLPLTRMSCPCSAPSGTSNAGCWSKIPRGGAFCLPRAECGRRPGGSRRLRFGDDHETPSNRKARTLVKMDIEGAEEAVFSENFEGWLGSTRALIIQISWAAKKARHHGCPVPISLAPLRFG